MNAVDIAVIVIVSVAVVAVAGWLIYSKIKAAVADAAVRAVPPVVNAKKTVDFTAPHKCGAVKFSLWFRL